MRLRRRRVVMSEGGLFELGGSSGLGYRHQATEADQYSGIYTRIKQANST